MSANSSANIHQGRNVKRFREMRGLKQEALAIALGDEWTQKKVSNLEASDTIEESIIDQVAKILSVPVEAIKSFSDEAIFNIVGNTYNDASTSVQYQCTFNPLDKLIEVYEENKKLYERLLASEQEKVELLKKTKLPK